MNRFFIFLLLFYIACPAGENRNHHWELCKYIEISNGYYAITSLEQTATTNPASKDPDLYHIAIHHRAADGIHIIMEKDFTLDEVNLSYIKNHTPSDIIKYDAPTRRVGFFLNDKYVTFVYTFPADTDLTDPKTAKVTPPPPPSTFPKPTPAELAKVKRFVPKVAYNDSSNNDLHLWTTLPKIEIIGTDTTDLAAFAISFNTAIFEAAGPFPPIPIDPHAPPPPPDENKITIYIGPSKEVFSAYYKIFHRTPNFSWHCWAQWGGYHSDLQKGWIFIATDRLSAQDARRMLARSLLTTAGFPGESREFPDSILYPDTQSCELSPVDKRLISFIYKYTKSGQSREAILPLITQSW